MNQRDKCSRFGKAEIFALLFFLMMVYARTYGVYFYSVIADAHNYVPAMEANYVSDWHSILFYKELIVAKNICLDVLNFIGSKATVESIFRKFSSFSIFAFLAVLSYLLKRLINTNAIYCWVFVAWIVTICFIFPNMVDHYWGNLESYNLVVLSMMIPIIIWIKNTSVFLRFFLFFILIVLCIHAVEYRKNAWVLMPIIAYVTAYQVNYLHSARIKRLVIFFLLLFSTYLGVVGVKCFIPHKEMHSSSVMLVSDIKIASHLLNEYDRESRWLAANCGLQHPERTRNLLRADSENKPVKFSCYDIIYRVPLNDNQWTMLKKRYLHYWKEYTKEMLIARMLSAQHLYGSVQTSTWIKKWLLITYPHLDGKHFALPSGSVWEDNVPVFGHMATLGAVFVSILLYMLLLIKRKSHFINLDKTVIVIFVSALVYYASFLVITPAPFSRYLGSSILTFWLLIPVIWTRCYLIYRKKV